MHTNGTVIAIGGNECKQDAAILGEFVDRAGGRDARIVIIAAASAEPQIRAAEYTRIFERFGAARVITVHAERGSVTCDELTLITNASGIFVTGGDQDVLMQHLRGTRCDTAIVEAVESGAVYAGTSAGAAAVSRTMIARSDDDNTNVVFAEGLGLVPNVIIDQHFSERARLPRLLDAVKQHGLAGVGIDEDTAIIFERGRHAVCGRGAVTLVDPDQEPRVLRA